MTLSPCTWKWLDNYRNQKISEYEKTTTNSSFIPSSPSSSWQPYFIDVCSLLQLTWWYYRDWTLLSLEQWTQPVLHADDVLVFILFSLSSVVLLLLGSGRWTQRLLQITVAVYQLSRMGLCVVVLGTVRVFECLHLWRSQPHTPDTLLSTLANVTTYKDYMKIATVLDIVQNAAAWKKPFKDFENMEMEELFNAPTLAENIHALTMALENDKVHHVMFLLTGCLKRNKLGIDSPSLHLHCYTGTKALITLFHTQVLHALEYVTTHPKITETELRVWLSKLQHSYGRSALCLSGGGALGMMHMGVVKVLIEAELLPGVISGSSGGSIVAGMLACKTNEELLEHVLVDTISTVFPTHRWFPPLFDQIAHFWKEGVLVNSDGFERTCQRYFGSPFHTEPTTWYTFQDAFVKTGRHVSITVSATNMGVSTGPRKLLLNHIHSPHVLIWSAVTVSCSLPGIMHSQRLMARNVAGEIVPYNSLGEKWMDGSLQHDLPFDTLSTCFNTTNFIVSQVNPHVVPFLSRDVHAPGIRVYGCKTMEQYCAADIRHRMAMLGTLGLIPNIHGSPFAQWFNQIFIGNVTIVPAFSWPEAIGVKAILNPTKSDMRRYIQAGEEATWPKMNYIQHLMLVEKRLEKCVRRVNSK